MDWGKVNAITNIATGTFIVGVLVGIALVAHSVNRNPEETPCAKRARLAAERKVVNDNVG